MKKSSATAEQELRTQVAIIGAGFGGLCMAIKLREAGHDDFVILEKAADVGGTWRDNSYPGAACDVQSHMYSYSFHGNPNWSKRYSSWREIQDYILQTTEKYGLRPFIRFRTALIGARYEAETALWHLQTDSGLRVVCRHFILASGPLHVPQIPKIPGLERFKGKVFHSAQWDHDFDLRGKKVVSIGTGGSAIQYGPEIAPQVERLYIFQRTPAWVIPRDERAYAEVEKQAFARFPLLRKLHRARLYWSNESRVWPIFHPSMARAGGEVLKWWIRWTVKDRQVAQALIPDYTLGCKRVLISNKWYPMFNRDNVELVTAGIREVREHSIVTSDGQEREADCIILGTGFVVDPRVYMQGMACVGLPGHDLMQDWKDNVEAYFGISVAGYPNMYQLVGPNSALGHNSIIFMIECQVHYILNCMKLLEKRGADSIDVREQAQADFNTEVQQALQGTVWSSGCVSWYTDSHGKNFTIWPWSTWRYWLRTRELKEEDFILARAPGKTAPAAATQRRRKARLPA